MSEIEKIRQIVERANLDKYDGYKIGAIEGLELSKAAYEAKDLPLEIILLAFNYGRVKGYRAAKAEARREQVH